MGLWDVNGLDQCVDVFPTINKKPVKQSLSQSLRSSHGPTATVDPDLWCSGAHVLVVHLSLTITMVPADHYHLFRPQRTGMKTPKDFGPLHVVEAIAKLCVASGAFPPALRMKR